MSADLAALTVDAQKASQIVGALSKMDLPSLEKKLQDFGSKPLTAAEFYQIVMLVLQETDGGLSIAGLFVPWAAIADEWVRVAEIVIPVAWPLVTYAVAWVGDEITRKPALSYTTKLQPTPVPFQAFGHSFTGAAF